MTLTSGPVTGNASLVGTGMKRLTVAPADLAGLSLGIGSGTALVEVTAWTDTDIEMIDGTVILAGTPMPVAPSLTGQWTVTVVPCDHERVAASSRGLATVTVQVKTSPVTGYHRTGPRVWSRTVQVHTTDPDVQPLTALPDLTGHQHDAPSESTLLPTYTTPSLGRVAIIGDSVTYQDGAGQAAVTQAFKDVGFADVGFYAVDAKTINTPDGNNKITVQNIADLRAQGEPDLWVIALITNNSQDSATTIRSQISAVLSAIGDHPSLWVGACVWAPRYPLARTIATLEADALAGHPSTSTPTRRTSRPPRSTPGSSRTGSI